ncbi:uncharacterized protein LOC141617649 [Silene latifolia]|uniref:uncharacterized protein LOC141617649 n=1 Tax=Silene latifolia TaxID=37657 RepID=UPI003D7778A5
MSGNWKAICKVKELFRGGYHNGVWLADQRGYNVGSGYNWVRHKEQKVGWAKLIWNPRVLPKHSFLCWLVFRNALNVKDKLCRIGICTDDKCCICDTDTETISHLIMHCSYSRQVLHAVCSWLCIPTPGGNAIIWIGRRKWRSIQKGICLAAVMAVYYHVWQQRNLARIEGKLMRPMILVHQIQQLVKSKVHQLDMSTYAKR